MLGVVSNFITMEEACLILKSAVDSGVCQGVEIGVNDDHYSNDEVKKMEIILTQRQEVGIVMLQY